jgi:hypothetical protein
MAKWWATKLTARDLEQSYRREHESIYEVFLKATITFDINDSIEVTALNEEEAKKMAIDKLIDKQLEYESDIVECRITKIEE